MHEFWKSSKQNIHTEYTEPRNIEYTNFKSATLIFLRTLDSFLSIERTLHCRNYKNVADTLLVVFYIRYLICCNRDIICWIIDSMHFAGTEHYSFRWKQIATGNVWHSLTSKIIQLIVDLRDIYESQYPCTWWSINDEGIRRLQF